MGYSYMMMELWIMEGISGKKKKRKKETHTENSNFVLVFTAL